MFKRKDLNWTSKIPLNAFVLAMMRNVKMSYLSSNTCLYFVCVCVCVYTVFLNYIVNTVSRS
jgi:hypothetical protein